MQKVKFTGSAKELYPFDYPVLVACMLGFLVGLLFLISANVFLNTQLGMIAVMNLALILFGILIVAVTGGYHIRRGAYNYIYMVLGAIVCFLAVVASGFVFNSITGFSIIGVPFSTAQIQLLGFEPSLALTPWRVIYQFAVATGEESVFRLGIPRIFAMGTPNWWVGNVISNILFAALHVFAYGQMAGGVWGTIALTAGAFIAGMIFSFVYRFVASQSPSLAILATILAHFGYNALVVI